MADTGLAAQVLALSAILEEMLFFNHIMSEHGKVLRSSLDLSEENLIQEAGRFAAAFASLEQKTECLSATDSAEIAQVREEAHSLTDELAAFKAQLERLLAKCEVQAIVDPDLIAHVRREALWYLGLLAQSCGQPTPHRHELGLPDGETRALLLPRQLIGQVPCDLNVVLLEYALFWVHIQEEHAAVLAEHTRPEVQRHLRRGLLAWQADLESLHHRGLKLAHEVRHNHTPTGRRLAPSVRRYGLDVQATITRFRDHLARLGDDLRHCRVPSGRTNFWPALAHHMQAEAEYLLDALRRILAEKKE